MFIYGGLFLGVHAHNTQLYKSTNQDLERSKVKRRLSYAQQNPYKLSELDVSVQWKTKHLTRSKLEISDFFSNMNLYAVQYTRTHYTRTRKQVNIKYKRIARTQCSVAQLQFIQICIENVRENEKKSKKKNGNQFGIRYLDIPIFIFTGLLCCSPTI